MMSIDTAFLNAVCICRGVASKLVFINAENLCLRDLLCLKENATGTNRKNVRAESEILSPPIQLFQGGIASAVEVLRNVKMISLMIIFNEMEQRSLQGSNKRRLLENHLRRVPGKSWYSSHTRRQTLDFKREINAWQ